MMQAKKKPSGDWGLIALLFLITAAAADFNISECGNLSAESQIYNLTGNVDLSANNVTCFNVTASHITLKCLGYNISGNDTGVDPNTTVTGINVTNYINMTIINCTFYNWTYPIWLWNASNSTIANSTSIEFYAYNSSDIHVDLPYDNCSYGWQNARIESANWTICYFNLTLASGGVIHVKSYEVPSGIPAELIIALGAGGLASILAIVYIIRRRIRRR